MQTKIYTIFLTIFFFLVFIILYKGLQKPNVYIPKLKTKIEVPSFDAKIFKTKTKINSKEIFKKINFIYLIFGLLGVYRVKMNILSWWI